MRVYRQSPKPLKILLSREERLIYTLCREEISDVLLAERTGLALDVVQEILLRLCQQGLLEVVVQGPSSPSPLQSAQERLMRALEAALGPKAQAYAAEIQSKASLGALEEYSRKLVLRLRLTISRRAAEALEAELKKIFPP
ncbi:hypothetical protein DV704_05895 [Meiothermus sp. QL-1]|uniref:hypothetical protein n=1 Tax=Meiothermus sp. QL-1 TaxID=2058095 RepID=UPI000E0BF66C|nr:hypothetical protein [Meiothermus sp. QL-1]RDI95802.1 hypothetical protein DV704_05895 [Meiothermus sp. QL-1]